MMRLNYKTTMKRVFFLNNKRARFYELHLLLNSLSLVGIQWACFKAVF